ncbi:hypothetical protein ACN8ZM_23345 [Burkholderia aenigmatica]|uniref:hypothetical protein n=1 Tax=Burkholderia aenigmatica TaxID=2015348 RepID=UPI003B433286
MLISFPFLGTPQPRTEDDRNDGTFGLGEKSGKGSFPVSHQFGWHGGVHLVAPGPDANPEPVRAIADGEVVFARPCAAKPEQNPTEQERDAYPLLYYAGWTSNGVVILKHQTEIGEGVEVVFYSIYQHLKSVAINSATKAAWTKGDKIYRKDPVGQAGEIYGRPNRIHFEIVADKANVEKLMGRSEGKLQASEGRRNCVWGDIHIVLPAGTSMYAVNPRTETRSYVVRVFDSTVGAANDTLESVAQRFSTTRERILALNGKTTVQAGTWWSRVSGSEQHALKKPAPTMQQRTIRVPAVYGVAATTPPDDLTAEAWAQWTVRPIGQTKEVLNVALSEARGTITLTTRDAVGDRRGGVEEAKGGYSLYKTATDTYPGCPSAGYEMLRFGRILGPDAPAATDLHEGRLPHFRKIAIDGGVTAYVDLNRIGVKVYSDADFPHWLGWTFIDDDTDGNSRCDSTQLLDMIEPMSPTPGADAATQYRNRLILAYAKTQAGELRDRLTYCVVKMPTEWARDDFDKRWDWLKGTDGESPIGNIVFPICLGDPAYEWLKRHHQALAFWEEAVEKGLTLKAEHYHFHPMQFIYVFKKSGWLSPAELKQVVPARALRGLGPGASTQIVYESTRAQAGQLVETNLIELNRALRKYGINTPERMAAFLGNSVPETAWLRVMQEEDADSRWYAPWIGRGFLQITHSSNYLGYWHWRGRGIDSSIEVRLRQSQKQADTQRSNQPLKDMERQLPVQMQGWREDVRRIAFDAADSSGYYWSVHKANYEVDKASPNIRRSFTLHITSQQRRSQPFAFYENVSFRRVSCLINLPGHLDRDNPRLNGLVDRYHAHAYAQVLLLDQPVFPNDSGVRQFLPEDYQVKGEAPR